MRVDKGTAYISEVLNKNGHQCYIVGGYVRDHIMGITDDKESDIDLVTDAKPENIIHLFKKTIPTGLKHGTVTVLTHDGSYEVTTFRQDGEYLDSRHPEEVKFVTDIKDDLIRRDFTINAMAYDIQTGTLLDLYGGQKDISNRLIRAVGDPNTRFREDALRIIRGIRFASTLNFNIEPKTLKSMSDNCHLLNNISKERIYTELKKILMSPVPSIGLNLMLYTGVLKVILPELLPMAGFNQFSSFHDKDVWFHTMQVVDNTRPELHLRLAALFHDAGKPHSFTMDENGKGHFYGHELISSMMAEEILTIFKSDNETKALVKTIIDKHMVSLEMKKPIKIKRLITDFGKDKVNLFFEFKKADLGGKPGDPSDNEKFNTLLDKVTTIIQNNEPLEIKDLNINGNDLLSIGFENGPRIGTTLNQLLIEVLNNPALNNKDELIKIALRLKDNIK